jgi:hypothetical protein
MQVAADIHKLSQMFNNGNFDGINKWLVAHPAHVANKSAAQSRREFDVDVADDENDSDGYFDDQDSDGSGAWTDTDDESEDGSAEGGPRAPSRPAAVAAAALAATQGVGALSIAEDQEEETPPPLVPADNPASTVDGLPGAAAADAAPAEEDGWEVVSHRCVCKRTTMPSI